jgi:hypothetical protein
MPITCTPVTAAWAHFFTQRKRVSLLIGRPMR